MLDRCARLAATSVPLADATGLVLDHDVVAREDVPPFANSAVDGYAVRALDVAGASDDAPVELDVIDEVPAGAASERTVGAGQAIRIMTGAPMPAGADASVMVEDTERLDGGARVRVRRGVEIGSAVRAAGDDVVAGPRLFGPGDVITPAVAGVLASINVHEVTAVRAARVAMLSTGDEMVDDGSPLRPGHLPWSTKTILLGIDREER